VPFRTGDLARSDFLIDLVSVDERVCDNTELERLLNFTVFYRTAASDFYTGLGVIHVNIEPFPVVVSSRREKVNCRRDGKRKSTKPQAPIGSFGPGAHYGCVHHFRLGAVSGCSMC
jgi:hypothetical protein